MGDKLGTNLWNDELVDRRKVDGQILHGQMRIYYMNTIQPKEKWYIRKWKKISKTFKRVKMFCSIMWHSYKKIRGSKIRISTAWILADDEPLGSFTNPFKGFSDYEKFK